MKKLLVCVLSCLLFTLNKTHAQDCSNLAYMQPGKKLEYQSSNAKGKAVSRQNFTVQKKVGDKATVKSEVFNEKNEMLASAETEMVCEGNALKIDMRSFVPSSSFQAKDMTVKADVSYLVYPTSLKEGQKLDDGNFSMQLYNKDTKMSDVTCDITNRKVEARETVTVPAGTYDCYKITYDTNMKTKTFGVGIPMVMHVTEWFSPKLGTYVKTSAANKAGKLMSETILQSIR